MAIKSSKFMEKKVVHTYTIFPSRYGSHKTMVQEGYKLKADNLVVCKDEYGVYVTEKSRLDSGLADPNRFSTIEFREKKFKEEAELQ